MMPSHDETAQLLRELADEALDRARYTEWVRQKVSTARADNRPALTIAEAKQRLHRRLETLAHG